MKGTLAFFMGPLLQNNKLPLKIALLSHFVADANISDKLSTTSWR